MDCEADGRAGQPVSCVVPLSMRIHRVLRISLRIPPTPDHGNPRSPRVNRLVERPLRIPLTAEFTYGSADPFTVAVTLVPNGEPPVTWHLSRDLLRAGLSAKSGAGDVQVWPTVVAGRAVLRLRLESGGVSAMFELGLDELAPWLERTYELVPPAEEPRHVDWDAHAADLFSW